MLKQVSFLCLGLLLWSAFPASATSSVTPNNANLELLLENNIGDATAYLVLEAVANETGLYLADLWSSYGLGEIEIEDLGDGSYRVTLAGGLVVIVTDAF